jgi:hypothetical protein
MPSFIIVEKNGSVKCTTSKTLNVSDLYKKCGFKTNDGFNCAHTWTIEFNEVEYKIQIYGKTNGRAGSENKYEFPPPIDNTLFFGSCAVINMEDDKIVDMNASEFKDIMDHLQGGYSDLDSEETEESDDSDPAVPKTKQGYVKDDFVVDDNDCEDDDSDYSSSVEELPKKGKGAKKGKVTKGPKALSSAKDSAQKYLDSLNIVVAKALECSDELVEEAYI